MPLTKKGNKIMSNMKQQCGDEKAKKVFYASRNAGTISGVDPETAGTKSTKKRTDKPGRSIIDVECLERKPETGTLKLSGYLYKPGETGHSAQKNHEFLSSWESREVKNSPDYKAEVYFHGPDTDFRVEEINPHHYGRDYEPSPLKDYWKTGDKAEEEGLRLTEEYKYSEVATPGTVQDNGLESSLAYGSISYTRVPSEKDDNRSFESQRDYRRSQGELEDDMPTVRKLKKY